MDFRDEIRRQRRALAESALPIAHELEAGRAIAPFQERLTQLASEPILPVRVALISTHPDALHGLLSEIIGQDFNVCKVVVPSRLGFTEVLLQERGFLLDTGGGPQEFDDSNSFLEALQKNHTLQQTDHNSLEPLRLKLKGPSHLNGLCLLIPHSLEALVRKPALLSTLADQADWVFLAGMPESVLTPEERSIIQLVLDHAVGLQCVLPAAAAAGNSPAAGSTANAAADWWKGWKVSLSLGVVRLDTELLRARLGLLTAPSSELRQHLVESRLLRQLEMTLALMDEEIRQSQKQLNNRANLSKEGIVGAPSGQDLRKAVDGVRMRLIEETDNILRAAERDAKAALTPDGDINRRLRETAQRIAPDDIEQTTSGATIRLTLAERVMTELVSTVSEIGRTRLFTDLHQIREGFECTVRDAENTLETVITRRHKLALDFPDEQVLWNSIASVARPEIRYRGEMPRPTLGTRFQTARQGIMGLMIAGTLLGGAASLTGDASGGGGNIRTSLYALMLPLLVIGFLWTYVSFRKKERLTLEKEVEKLQDGVFNELRRVVQDLQREQQTLVNAALQKSVRGLQQQIDAAAEQLDRQRQRETEDQRRRQTDQLRSVEQRGSRLRQFSSQIATFQARQGDAHKIQRQWLASWIATFNQGKI